MASYRVEITPKAAKQFAALPAFAKPRIAEAINGLADKPRPHAAEKLTGMDGYRVRVGDYRVLFIIDDDAQVVTVYRVMHRRDVYRGN